MKKLQLFRAVCACVILFTFASSEAAIYAGSTGGAFVVQDGSDIGFTSIDASITDINGGQLYFDTVGATFDDFYINVFNNTGTPWDNVKFEFISADINAPISVTPTTGTLIGADLSLNVAWLFFDPPETDSLLNGHGLLETPNSTFSLVITPNVVPVPAAVWLFGSGLLGLIGVARRKK